MSNVFDRFSKVAKAEWSHLTRRGRDDAPADVDADLDAHQRAPGERPGVARPFSHHGVGDVDAARRVLELDAHATLDAVRARYREMARRYQPKTQSPRADEREAAHTLMLALTDALEMMEEHLLPLP